MSQPERIELLRMARRARATLTGPAATRAARITLLAGLLATAFAVATHSSSEGHETAPLAEALRRGADRLVALQAPTGAWSDMPGSKANMRQAGKAGRALLLAHRVTRNPTHLRAARRAAEGIARELRDGRGDSSANLLFLAELGQATGQPALTAAADAAWMRRYQSTAEEDGREAARQFLATPNRGGRSDGAWRNYLLLRAAEEADLARALGHAEWADAWLLEAAGAWAPRHDHDQWASAAGAMLAALARSDDPRSTRYELAHRGLLESNERLAGIAWNDTPYDDYVYLSETSAALAGRARQERGAGVGSPTFQGLEFLASRQASHGGWGAVLSLIDGVARDGDDDAPPAEAAWQESPLLDAQAVRALAIGLGADG